MKQLKYPKADTKAQWFPKFGGVAMDKITKLVLHSTESSSWPGYPTFAPQFTYNPWTRQWRQHMDANRSASTLRDPSSTSVRENRDDVVQVEIIGFADRTRPANRWIRNMPETALIDLGHFAAWLHEEWGLPLTSTVKWVDYPQSYGVRASQRLSGPEYDRYTGILGHQHVSGNDHGDPGIIDVNKIIANAKLILNPAPTPGKNPPAPSPSQEQKGLVGMKEIYGYIGQDQPVKKGQDKMLAFELNSKKEKNYSVVIDENDGVDVVATVVVSGLKHGQQAEIWWFVMDYKAGETGTPKGSHRLADRIVVGDDGMAKGSTVFKGRIKAPSAKGRTNRLRLMIRVPSAATVKQVQVEGWSM